MNYELDGDDELRRENSEESTEKNYRAYESIEFYRHFLIQGLEILEAAYEVHKRLYIKKKIILFQNMIDDIETSVIIGGSIYESVYDIPEPLRKTQPERFAELARREDNYKSINDFLDKVR